MYLEYFLGKSKQIICIELKILFFRYLFLDSMSFALMKNLVVVYTIPSKFKKKLTFY